MNLINRNGHTLFFRYFIEVTLEALCIEWAIVLGVLLLDVSVLARIVETVQKQGGVEGDVFTRVVQGMEEMYTWAESEWYVCYVIASFPGLPVFCSLVCVQYNTWKRKSAKRAFFALFRFRVLY